MSSNYVKQCQNIVDEYRKAGNAWPARKIDIAEWALANRKWDLGAERKLRVCADDLAEAMRQETFIDELGRRVRTKHPAKMKIDGQQGTFWDDMFTAKPEFFRQSVGQRRNGIVAECIQISNDVRFFNGLHPDAPIQIVLDFSKDVAEADELKVTRRSYRTTLPSATSSTARAPRPAQRRTAVRPTASLNVPSHPVSHPSPRV